MMRVVSLGIVVLLGLACDARRPCRTSAQCETGERCAIDAGAKQGVCAIAGEGEGEGDGGEGEGEGEGEGTPAGADVVEMGQGFACAIDTGAHVQCWGRNFGGELGRVTDSDNAPQAAARVALLTDVDGIASAPDHTCVTGRFDAGQRDLWCFGEARGFLPDGFTSEPGEMLQPVALPAGFGRDIVSIDADGDSGGAVTCATDGVQTWCFGIYAPTGDGRSVEVPALAGASEVAVFLPTVCGHLDAGWVCANLPNASVVGDLCGGTIVDRVCTSLPAFDAASSLSVTSGTLCRSDSGVIRCAGDNEFGIVTPGQQTAGVSADVDTGVAGGTVRVGLQHACAIDSTNTVVCWGRTLTFQTGIDDFDAAVSLCDTTDEASCQGVVPVPMPAGLSLFRALATRRSQSCAISVDNRVVCWGDAVLAPGGEPAPPSEVILSP